MVIRGCLMSKSMAYKLVKLVAVATVLCLGACKGNPSTTANAENPLSNVDEIFYHVLELKEQVAVLKQSSHASFDDLQVTAETRLNKINEMYDNIALLEEQMTDLQSLGTEQYKSKMRLQNRIKRLDAVLAYVTNLKAHIATLQSLGKKPVVQEETPTQQIDDLIDKVTKVREQLAEQTAKMNK